MDFSVEQYCLLVDVFNELDKVKLVVSRPEKDVRTWWPSYLLQHSDALTDGQQNMLDCQLFCDAILDTFRDLDRNIKLQRHLAALHWHISMARYTCSFCQVVLELGKCTLDEDVLI